ncbi:MAG: hypothetical protein ABSE89_01110 [Sedimentisphaerales bacterium]
MNNNGLFSATNKKYFASEIVSYIAAAAAASGSAAIADLLSDSDFIITIISTIIGTIGFIISGLGTYAILNIVEYKKGSRDFVLDMKSMFISDIQGIWAAYLLRIPLQYFMQKFGVLPVVAAPIAQVISGQVGTIVRVYSNYKKKIFGSHNGKD